MSAQSLSTSTTVSQTSSKLKRGKIRIYSSTTIYWMIGENPTASSKNCAVLRAGETIEIKLPVSCSRLAVLAVNEPGVVTVTEVSGGAKASCAQ